MRGSMLSSKLSKRGASFDLFEGLRLPVINALDSTDIDRWGNLRDLPTKALEMVNCHGDFLMVGNSSH